MADPVFTTHLDDSTFMPGGGLITRSHRTLEGWNVSVTPRDGGYTMTLTGRYSYSDNPYYTINIPLDSQGQLPRNANGQPDLSQAQVIEPGYFSPSTSQLTTNGSFSAYYQEPVNRALDAFMVSDVAQRLQQQPPVVQQQQQPPIVQQQQQPSQALQALNDLHTRDWNAVRTALQQTNFNFQDYDRAVNAAIQRDNRVIGGMLHGLPQNSPLRQQINAAEAAMDPLYQTLNQQRAVLANPGSTPAQRAAALQAIQTSLTAVEAARTTALQSIAGAPDGNTRLTAIAAEAAQPIATDVQPQVQPQPRADQAQPVAPQAAVQTLNTAHQTAWTAVEQAMRAGNVPMQQQETLLAAALRTDMNQLRAVGTVYGNVDALRQPIQSANEAFTRMATALRDRYQLPANATEQQRTAATQALNEARAAWEQNRTQLMARVSATTDQNLAGQLVRLAAEQGTPQPAPQATTIPESLRPAQESQTDPARAVTQRAQTETIARTRLQQTVANTDLTATGTNYRLQDGRLQAQQIEVRSSAPANQNLVAVLDPSKPNDPPQIVRVTPGANGQPPTRTVLDANAIANDPAARAFQTSVTQGREAIVQQQNQLQQRISQVRGFNAHFAKNSHTLEPSEMAVVDRYLQQLRNLPAGTQLTVPVSGMADTTGDNRGVTEQRQREIAQARQQEMIRVLQERARALGIDPNRVNFVAGDIYAHASERTAGVGAPQIDSSLTPAAAATRDPQTPIARQPVRPARAELPTGVPEPVVRTASLSPADQAQAVAKVDTQAPNTRRPPAAVLSA